MLMQIKRNVQTHWNYGYRYFMIALLVGTTVYLGFLFVLPKHQEWGLSMFDGGVSLFVAITMPLLIQVITLPATMLHLLASPRRRRLLPRFMPQSPKQIYLSELMVWAVGVFTYLGLLSLGYTWIQDMINEYEMYNVLAYSTKTLPRLSLFMIIIMLQMMLGTLYTFAKQVNGKWVIATLVILNIFFYFVIETLSVLYQVQVIMVYPVIILVLLGLLIWKFDWINKIYQ